MANEDKTNRIQNPRTRFLTPSIFRDQSTGLYASDDLFMQVNIPSHLRKHHTEIRLTYPTLVEVLTAPDCLLYLSIEGTTDLETWPNHFNVPGFELHHLKALQICCEGMMAGMLLRFMSAPILESLWLEFDFWCFDTGFGSSKFPQLRYLTLPGIHLALQFAAVFPSITHLHLPRAKARYFRHLETALSNHWFSLHTLVFTALAREAHWKNIGDLISHGCPINNLLVDDRDVLYAIEREVSIPVETVELISGENYLEPWWNQEDRLNA